MNYNQLKTFATVVETGGFIAAAKVLHRTQPAVTAAIKNLETTLGLQLFQQDCYRATLTTAGKAFYQKTILTLEQMQDLKSLSENLKAGIETDLSIAIDIFCPLEPYLPVFDELLQEFSHTHFHFYSEALGGATEQLLANNVDIAITENLASLDEVEAIKLDKIDFIPVVTPTYLAKNKKFLFNKNLLPNCVQVITKDSSRSKQKYSFGVLKNARHWTVADALTKKQVICAHMGWGRLPAHLITKELANGTLIQLTGKSFEPRQMQLCALRKRNSYYGPVAEKVWQMLNNISEN